MRLTESQAERRDLTGSQAARLLREGRLGEILLRRAEAAVARHRAVATGDGDQADGLRRAVRAHEGGSSRAAPADGAAA